MSESASRVEVPEELRAKLLGMLGDFRLYHGKSVPMELIVPFMLASVGVDKYVDEKFSTQLRILVLALLPPQDGEEVPDGIEKIALYWIEDSIKKLGGSL